MKKLMISLAVSLALTSGASMAAGDAEAGKAKSAMCAACHGADGKAPGPLWPNLAGQKKGYLAKQLKAFRDGSRVDPSMNPMAKGLSDDDIANLAAYYSSL